MLIGIASNRLDTKLVRDFFRSLYDCSLLSLTWLIKLAPLGICSLIIEAVFEIEDFGTSVRQIAIFALVCTISIVTYGSVFLIAIFMIIVRKNPIKYFYYFIEPVLIAFATTSGYVCIQKTIEVCENKLNMDSRIYQFCVPFFTIIEVLRVYCLLLFLEYKN